MKFQLLTLLVFLPILTSAATLTGKWKSSWQKEDNRYRELYLSFDGPYLKYEKIYSKQANSAQATQQYIWMATHEVFRDSVEDPFWKIDFVLEGVYLRPLTADQTEQFNTTSHCGYTDWKNGELKEVTAKWCGDNQFGPKGFKAYNILSKRGEKLQIDLEASAPSVVQRPKSPGNVLFDLRP